MAFEHILLLLNALIGFRLKFVREIRHIYYSHQARCEYKKNLSPT